VPHLRPGYHLAAIRPGPTSVLTFDATSTGAEAEGAAGCATTADPAHAAATAAAGSVLTVLTVAAIMDAAAASLPAEAVDEGIPTRLTDRDLENLLRRYSKAARHLRAEPASTALAPNWSGVNRAATSATVRPDGFYSERSLGGRGIEPSAKGVKRLHALAVETSVLGCSRTVHPAFTAVLWIILRADACVAALGEVRIAGGNHAGTVLAGRRPICDCRTERAGTEIRR
jgi:hypothetical protein